MTVNELAKAAGVEPNGLRYYARIGLLRPKRHPENGDKLFRSSCAILTWQQRTGRRFGGERSR